MSNTPARSLLLVLTSHAALGDTGRATGAYLPEVAHPWKVFRDAGFSVDLVSVVGGAPPIDGADLDDPVQRQFWDDPEMSRKLSQTLAPHEVRASDYDVVFYAGGHGAMWDFPRNAELAEISREVYEAGGVIAAVCHGPAGLLDITLSDGRRLIDGKEVSAFTNDEETAVGLSEIVPFMLQSRLEDLGAKHTGSGNFQPWVVVDGRLVTGQNPASAIGVARQALNLLNER